ncbi:MAG TPA: dienelactone hydrolase family protein [Caulobacteraceae bacterium]|nr:dienelactone hydrolase family protein [Caulobacteraceae bacterium]
MIDGPRVAPATGAAPRSLVILLHGYGSNGDDLISLAPHWRGLLPGSAFIAPNAPEPCPGAPGGYQWWALTSADRAARAVGVARAAPILDAFIDAELASHGLTEAELALVGFSQGTMMALHVGPRRQRPLAGIVGYSGMLADKAGLATTRPPVLLVHGDADPMIPVAAHHQASADLAAAGFPVQGHVSPGLGHSIDLDGLRLGGAFLARVLS